MNTPICGETDRGKPCSCGPCPLRVSVAGPIGSGKTQLIHNLSKQLWPAHSLAVATVESLASSLWSSGDPSAQILQQQGILPLERIRPIPHLTALPDLADLPSLELLFVEYGGNDLATAFNPDLVDLTIYVVDIIGRQEIICNGGTGITHSDLLVLNKADLAPHLGISLTELAAAVHQQRGDRPFAFTNLSEETGGQMEGKQDGWGDQTCRDQGSCTGGLNEIVRWLTAYLLLPIEQRAIRKEYSTLIEEQWFWRYKMSRGAHTHFDTIERKKPLSSAPMSAAPISYTDDGQVAWDQMWTDFCDLAAIGGPPHRGTLLEPVSSAEVRSDPEVYAQVVAEIERGIQLVTDLTTLSSPIPGWVGVECADEMMAIWLQQAILVENVSVRRDGSKLYLPAGPTFQLKAEIKNVITVIAKTHHYWQEHLLRQRDTP